MARKQIIPESHRFAGLERLIIAVAVLSLLLAGLIGILSKVASDAYTRVELAESGTGRTIFCVLLQDGEEATLSWRNSLFGLDVTEVFVARHGMLVMDRVTFADPRGLPPPEVSPSDVDDLYHTGGPFTARGLGKSFNHVIYRVSEIGNPILRIRDRTTSFKQEAGFGGGVVLNATRQQGRDAGK